MPNCSYRLPVSGAKFFFLLVSALIFPQLPASYQCWPQSLWQRFLAGKGAAFDLIIVIEGLPLSAATTLSSFWRRTSNLHKHSFNIYPQKRFRCCIFFFRLPLFTSIPFALSKSRHNLRTFLAKTNNFG